MVSAGRVLIVGKGEWNALTDYQQLDMVSYDNKAYLARQASVGVNPSTDVSMTYWQPFGSAAEPDQETIIKNSEGELAVNIDGDTIVFDQEAGKLKATLGVSALTDITILNPSNNQVLRYNSTTRKWENKSLGSAADKSSTNELSQGNQGLIESGAVFDEFQNVYKVNDQAITSVASDDLMPIYDTSATGKKKIAVSNFIGGLVSNPNLLDNPWFTVNQRGQSSYSGVGYTVDRWIIPNTKTAINVNSDNSVSLGGVEDNSTSFIQEKFDVTFFNKLKGKTVTFSIMLDDGTVLSKTGTFPSSYNTELAICSMNDTVLSLSAVYIKTSGQVWVQVGHIYNGTSRTIKAVKLELGSVSTLAIDTAPNYAEELLKCQRYFVRLQNKSSTYKAIIGIGQGRAQNSSTNLVTSFPLPVEMRANPTITFSQGGVSYSQTSTVVGEGENATNISGLSLAGYIRGAFISGNNITAGDSYMVFLNIDGYIDFSADL